MEAAGDEERPLLHHPPPHLHQDGDSRYTNDGTVDVNGQPAVKASTGNLRACFFILGVQFSECLAFFAISKNLVTYLTSVLHESNIDAARNVSTWFGTTFFTPLIGAFLADTYWGRYKTLVVFLSVYIVGMLVLTVSTTLPWMIQSSNHSEIHRITVYVGLYLTALGNGGIKPCTSTFGADQFDITDPTERVKKGSFFNWFYFLNTIGSLLSTTVIVWVQDNVGWGIGFAIPMILTSLSFTVFIASRRIYRYKSTGESPMTTASRVVVAAARNRRLELPEDCTTLHHSPSPPSEATFNVQHTTQFRFLDKAAIVSPSTQEKKGTATSPWRLCALSHVEEVKMLLRLCPAWASLVVFFMITAQMSSTVIEQVPLARRATGEDRGLTQPQRLGVGLALSTLAMAYLALLERNRLAVGEAVSIMWQAPAYAVMGVSEVFTVIGTLELFYDRAPDNMRSLCTAFAQLAIAAGSYLNSAALGVVASATMWIPEDLDDGHLDYFFWTIAALSALNLLQFVFYSMSCGMPLGP
uniref:Peptide transporter PTR2 n=1 Tax=Aegilops tauschii subsp. strangulata TaxID=200361 RepID=A0A453A7Q0_AEGTS